MKVSKKTVAIGILCALLIAVITVITIQIKKSGEISEADLVKPNLITIDQSLDKATLNKSIRAARLFYTFWNTGQYKYLDAAVAPTFVEHNLQKDKPLDARDLKGTSNQLRGAIPDLHCSIEELLISGNKVTARLLYTGTSQGQFMGHEATGKPVKFSAIDILQIQNGKIIENWHVEDKLALFEQLHIVAIKS
ncbi:MAG: ester cyclase [Gammaproteobacteria bacterium]